VAVRWVVDDRFNRSVFEFNTTAGETYFVGNFTDPAFIASARNMAPCLLKSDDSAVRLLQSCQSGNASAVLVSGAGSEAVNGRYTACAGCGGLYRDVKFMKDPSHAMYLFERTWRIAEPGVKVWYEAANGSQLGDGQPWVLKAAADAGVAPPPSRVACEPCATTPCPQPSKPAHCPAFSLLLINPECTGIMGYRSASGSPHGPWEGPTLLQGTTPSSSSWTGPDGIDNPSIMDHNGTFFLTGRTCGGKVERPWVATSQSWDGPYSSVERNSSRPVFQMVNAEVRSTDRPSRSCCLRLDPDMPLFLGRIRLVGSTDVATFMPCITGRRATTTSWKTAAIRSRVMVEAGRFPAPPRTPKTSAGRAQSSPRPGR